MANVSQMRRNFQLAAWAMVLSIGAIAQAHAATTDLSSVPLASSSSTVVRPNVLFTLDDSGSMDWDYLPDYAGGRTYSGGSANHCKVSNSCGYGETPFHTNEYNGMAYNPRITYQLPVNADGTLKASQVSPWTAVKIDGYNIQSTSTINLTTGYKEVRYCDSDGNCKRNGVDTNNPFLLRASVSADNPPEYAFPGTLTTSDTVLSTVHDGPLNQAVTASGTIYNGILDISTGAFSFNLINESVSGVTSTTLSVTSFSHSGSVVTVNHDAVAPALQNGDSVTVSGSNCSSGWRNNGVGATITVVSSTSFTYTSSRDFWLKTDCSFVVTRDNQVVTVTHNPTLPPLATGDRVKVSGSTCDAGYKNGGANIPITVVDATHFTYIATDKWTDPAKKSCSITASRPAHTATPPMISKSGNTVTVTLATAPSPALATGNLVTVANGAGTCDAGYRATSAPMTRISSTSFSYSVATGVTTATNTDCNVTQVGIVPPVSPGIGLSGTTVTVYKTSHGLVTGDLVQVSDGSSGPGTCDSGYRTSGARSITRIDANTFRFSPPVGSVTANSDCKIDKMLPGTTASYTTTNSYYANPYYFVIIPTEYCDSIYLSRCVAATAPVTVSGVTYSYPAPVRFCKDTTTAALPPGAAGAQTSVSGTINCQAKYSVGTGINFQAVRYGLFWRGDIVPTRTTYGDEHYTGTVNAGGVNLAYSNTLMIDRSSRSDCAAAPNCTYAEEMTNFANWYAYYHTRMQMMKSSAGRAFLGLDHRYRIGFATINESSTKYLPVGVFDATQKTNWYAKFYAVNPSGSTPLREALAHAGRYFAGKKPGMFTDDPMEYACQQNFELLTTDGYWNGTSSDVKEMDGTTTMRNYDNVDSGASQRRDGAYDGGLSGATNTLADSAMYYYKTDLRNSTLGNCTGAPVSGISGDVCADIVPMTDKDRAAGLAATQHMTTFALGLADGLMTYQSDYETAVTGDVSKIKTSALGCSFSGAATCNWPLPAADTQTALDDLWHAAVNGRGTYYNARDPASLSAGLSNALAGINVRLAAAAASATSSPNITQTDRSIFSSTYRTTKWDGEVVARYLNATTGAVEPDIVWSAQAQLDAMVHADTTPSIASRHIYTFDDTNAVGNHIKDFLYENLTATERGYFDDKCTSATLLTQCTAATLTAAEILSANSGLNLVHYLRGNQSLEPNIYRAREHFLGDTVNAKPVYVKAPNFSFLDAGYSDFKSAQAGRQGVLYIGANDGMLHAINTDTGAEMWTYIPQIVTPNLYKLADTSYATLHRYYVDGSPESMDIFVDDAAAATSGLTAGWHTILVGGLGLGGRGYYALDVTDPDNPIALWEVCSDSTLCAISDVDMGYSYGNPVITKRSSDGKWVVLVASGYNNVSPGSGEGILFVLDAVSGAILSKVSTGGATNPPSGLSKISAWIDSINTNFTARYVYAGDLNGDVWRFDLGAVGSTAAPTATKIASLKDDLGAAQSVTTSPELGDPMNNTGNSLSGTGNPGVFVGTGRYLGATDLSNVQVQSVYALKDDLSLTGTAAYIGDPRAPEAGFAPFVRQYIYESQSSAAERDTSQTSVSWASDGGWYADLEVTTRATNMPISPSVSPGERVNLDPHLVTGTLIVITNVPETSACTIGGRSWIYSFDFLTGRATADSLGNSLAVGNVIVSTGEGLKSITTLAGGDIINPDIDTKGSAATQRTSWRELVPQ